MDGSDTSLCEKKLNDQVNGHERSAFKYNNVSADIRSIRTGEDGEPKNRLAGGIQMEAWI